MLARKARYSSGATACRASGAIPALVGEKLNLTHPTSKGYEEDDAEKKQKALKHYIDDYLN